MIGVRVLLIPAGIDCPATRLVALLTECGLALPRYLPHVLGRLHHGLDNRCVDLGVLGTFRLVELLAAFGAELVVRQIGMIRGVGLSPRRFMALKGFSRADIGRLRRERDHLGINARPVVVHPLRIAQVAHNPAKVALSLVAAFFAGHPNYGDVLTG